MNKHEQQARLEFKAAHKSAQAAQPVVEPTEDERRNGWTSETLTAYLVDQRAAQSLRINPNSAMNRRARRPDKQNGRYRPLRWKG